jgi:hypothetical protein
VRVEFDVAKNERNIRERGISFELAADFDWTTAYVIPQERDGESRFLAFGFIGDRLHAMAFTKRGSMLRIISLRRANRRERKRYEEAKA